MLQKLINQYCRFLSVLMVAALVAMVVLVFTNVFLRYAFNSGIAVSEELSRWLFVWLTFMGAVVALNENGHLGTDAFVSKLPLWGKKICLGIGHVLMLYIAWLIFQGTLEQVKINWTSTSAAMEVSMAIFYGCGLVFAASAGVILLNQMWRLVTNQLTEADLAIRESDDMPHGDPKPAP
jgi:TRAP-type C4-dicarboxylate transport system permease small subunit